MPVPSNLARALRASLALREKLVLVRVGAAALASPPALDALAEEAGLLRSLGARLALVCPDAASTDALAKALSRAGERPAPVQGGALVKMTIPGMLPIVEGLLPSQLGALGWVPVMEAPAALGADAFAAALAVSGGAERLVFQGGAPDPGVVALLAVIARPFLEASGSLLEGLLLPDTPRAEGAAPAPSSAPVLAGAGAALLGGRP